jgi:DNA polymerase II large subunit
MNQLLKLRDYISENGIVENGNLLIPRDDEIKEILIELSVLHEQDQKRNILVVGHYSLPLIRCLGLDNELNKKEIGINGNGLGNGSVIDQVSEFAGITIKPRALTRIGASMGRPEKAKERMMKPPVHVLFPLGNAGGNQRLVKNAAENSKITIEAGIRRCVICGKQTIFTSCDCGGHTINPFEEANKPIIDSMLKRDIPIKEIISKAQKRINEPLLPDIKAVIGLISKYKTPEPLEKGILRAKHGVYVFKDGTSRFDMTDVPLTHFKPKEIGTTIEKLHQLGYTHDYKNQPLTEPCQIVELKPQDIIPSRTCGDYLLKVSKFIDDLLTKFYKMDPFYSAEDRSDLLGHIVMGLSPHTSGAVLGRLIGYTRSRVGYAHPFYHAAKRRNCDGDEDCVMLLLDGLINFSRSYLPGTRGGFMDAPLVFMTYINPNEIDKEAQNIDIEPVYPLEFYQATEKYMKPKDLEKSIETVSRRIGTCGQFENFGFMFDTDDINLGPTESAYTRLGSMIDKMEAQLALAKKIRAVDASRVAAKVIETHFLPDMIGNLRSFSKQGVRCPKCNAKYRRVPLKGICTRKKPDGNMCGKTLTMTVHRGGVEKYLEVAKEIAVRYKVSKYTYQRILLTEKAIQSTFQNDKVKKATLDDFI